MSRGTARDAVTVSALPSLRLNVFISPFGNLEYSPLDDPEYPSSLCSHLRARAAARACWFQLQALEASMRRHDP